MKKKLLTSLGCLALAVAGAFGLVGCGGPVEHTVSFGDVTANFGVGGAENYTISGVKWDKLTAETAEDEHFDEYKGAWQIASGEEIGYVKQAINGTDHNYVCVTFAGKGANIKNVIAKVKTSYDAEWGEDQNKDADPEEQEKDAFHLLISVQGEGTSTAKSVWLFLDWDGDEETEGDQEVYKFVIPQGLLLTSAGSPQD